MWSIFIIVLLVFAAASSWDAGGPATAAAAVVTLISAYRMCTASDPPSRPHVHPSDWHIARKNCVVL